MDRSSSNILWGVIFIIVGVGLMLNYLGVFYFNWETAWPWIMILFGIYFYAKFFLDRRQVGALMPGSILLTYGILFESAALSGWYLVDTWWPVFIMGPGIGLLAMYAGGKRESGVLFSGFLLLAITVIFLLNEAFEVVKIWPLIIILVGVYMIYKGLRGEKKTESSDTNNQPPQQ